jgi:hypothetical protein
MANGRTSSGERRVRRVPPAPTVDLETGGAADGLAGAEQGGLEAEPLSTMVWPAGLAAMQWAQGLQWMQGAFARTLDWQAAWMKSVEALGAAWLGAWMPAGTADRSASAHAHAVFEPPHELTPLGVWASLQDVWTEWNSAWLETLRHDAEGA